jgi:hypothetical protein
MALEVERGRNALRPEGTSMPIARLGMVLLISAAFAGAFAGIVRYTATTNRFGVECRVSSNPACLGPYWP